MELIIAKHMYLNIPPTTRVAACGSWLCSVKCSNASLLSGTLWLNMRSSSSIPTTCSRNKRDNTSWWAMACKVPNYHIRIHINMSKCHRTCLLLRMGQHSNVKFQSPHDSTWMTLIMVYQQFGFIWVDSWFLICISDKEVSLKLAETYCEHCWPLENS